MFKFKFIRCIVSLSLCVLLNITQSCNNTPPSPKANPFKQAKIYHSDFYTYKGDREAGSHIAFLYKADVKNTAPNIYENVVVRIGFELYLENGTIITDRDMSLLPPSFKIIPHWRSGEIQLINGIDYLIPAKFADYPIVKVLALFNFRYEDLINKQKDNEVTGVKDVTEQWKKAVTRLRDNQWQLTSPFGWDKVGTLEGG